jgi:hypothetical protein
MPHARPPGEGGPDRVAPGPGWFSILDAVQDGPDDDLVKEVFAQFGLAVYLAEALERSLVTALTTLYGPGTRRLSDSELETRFEALNEASPAAVLKELRGAGISAETLPLVRAAMADRNRLSHHFFGDHAFELASAEGCRRMLDELAQMQDRFSDCNARVEAEVHDWAASHGITTEDRDAVHQAMLDRGRILSDEEVQQLVGSRREGTTG